MLAKLLEVVMFVLALAFYHGGDQKMLVMKRKIVTMLASPRQKGVLRSNKDLNRLLRGKNFIFERGFFMI